MGKKALMLAGAAVAGLYYFRDSWSGGASGYSGNVGSGSGVNTGGSNVVDTQPTQNVQVANAAETRKPSTTDVRWYLQVKSNANPEFFSMIGKPGNTLRVKDWDYYLMSKFGISGGGGENYTSLDQYIQVLLDKGVVS